MVNLSGDALIVVPRELRNTIKSEAAKKGVSMREYLKLLVEGSDKTS